MAVEYSIDEQIAELDRELRIREKVYPRWINAAKPKLTPEAADRQMGRMRAARESLVRLRAMQVPSS